ncbi:endonuclease [Maribellus sp. YY47]|uniref:endonuclease n=1 Tax=Maribellus sp. YY47 TaxID=2929486 RepID=UPI0020008FAB|nr:endonuclease [Maribellus sp. YY47]MCK3685954.1 endonuclease [Maribellus sp. YY47]
MHYSISWKKSVVFTFLICLNGILLAQPMGYYNGTENLSGEQLKSALHEIINDHVDFSYARVRDIINYSDADPNNPNNVILFYSQVSRNASNYGTGGDYINREHVWAKSHGDFEDIRSMNGDALNLRPADASVNEDRSNLDFDNVQPNGTRHPEATDCWYSAEAWEPGPLTKGQVARILFYMATRYEADGDEIDLELADQLNTYPLPKFGKLSTLIKWNNDYPPSDFERRRNERIFRIQQNRNPFVDHPEFVDLIWGNGEPATTSINELNMQPEKPLPGENVTISCRVSSNTTPDSVMLYWGPNYNSAEQSVRLNKTDNLYSTTIQINELPDEMIYFTIKARSGADSAIMRGSYLIPEIIQAENITPIKTVQGTGNNSPLTNQTVTISGRITANFDYSFYMQDSKSPRNGINVYNTLFTGNVGDSVVIRGKVAEYSTLTEILDVEYFYNFGNKQEVKPVTITCSQIGEDYEGVLVQLKNVSFTNAGQLISEGNNTYSFSDETGQSVLFSASNSRLIGKKLPSSENNIVGVISQYNGVYQLLARDITDLSIVTGIFDVRENKEQVTVYPNPAQNILHISDASGLKYIRIFTTQGSLVLGKELNSNQVDVSSLNPGIYLIQFETTKGKNAFAKFSKQ